MSPAMIVGLDVLELVDDVIDETTRGRVSDAVDGQVVARLATREGAVHLRT